MGPSAVVAIDPARPAGQRTASRRDLPAVNAVRFVPLALVVVAAVLLVCEAGVFGLHAMQAVRFGGELDYGEAPLVSQALSLLHGHDIYHDDSVAPYVVANYPPVYPLLLAVAGRLFGATLAIGRAISAAATISVAALLGLLTNEASLTARPVPSTGTRLVSGIIAGGVYLSARWVWWWGVLGRVDAVALAFALTGLLAALRYRRAGSKGIPFFGTWFLLALLTRQTAVEGLFAAACCLGWRDRRKGLALVGLVGVGAVLVLALLEGITRGQFAVHTVLYNLDRFTLRNVGGWWRRWVLDDGGAPLLVAGLAASLWWFRTGGDGTPTALIGASAVASLETGKVGSALNYFLPLNAGLCWGVGLLTVLALSPTTASVRWRRTTALAVGLAIWIFGLPIGGRGVAGVVHERLLHGVNSVGWLNVPQAQPGQQWNELLALVRSAPGPVVSQDMSIVVLAGKPIAFQPFEMTQAAMAGVWNPAPFVEALGAGRYSLVILPSNLDAPGASDPLFFTPAMYSAMRKAYRLEGHLAGQWIYAPTSITGAVAS